LLLDDLFGEFPFVGDAERAHVLALVLLPFVRPMISGPTPLHMVEKPAPGTGAGLMIDAISIIATGTSASVMVEAATRMSGASASPPSCARPRRSF
jgi:putative DNA primase/helicase